MNDDEKLSNEQESRRTFIKKAVYVPPTILTLQAAPAYAKYGSEKPTGGWDDDKSDKKDKGEKGNKDD